MFVSFCTLNIVVISSSFKVQNGNTNVMVNTFLEGAQEAEGETVNIS